MSRHRSRARLLCEPLETRLVPSGLQRWSDPATWGGQVPGPGADVLIRADQNVLLDVDTAPLANLEIDGSLSFADQDLELTSKQVTVQGGTLQIGTEDQPFTHRATVTLTGTDADPHHFVSGTDVGTKGLVVLDGTLDLHGAARTGWLRLAATAQPGDTQITLTDPVNWQPGDRIVIASGSAEQGEAETETVTAVDGPTVTFAAPLRYRHWGELQSYAGYSLDERSEVGLLTHNVLVRSADDAGTATGFGGHTMLMADSLARVSNVEFDRLGQFNQLDRYPLHWNLAGDATGSYADNNSIHDSLERGLVFHGTDNVLVRGNVVYNTVGHNIATEDGSETGNVFEDNLALVNHNANFTFDQDDFNASNFWVRGAANTFRGNVAAGGDGSGFWFDSPDGADMTFEDNTVHSFVQLTRYVLNGSGVALNSPVQERFGSSVFRGLTIHHTTQGIWTGYGDYYPTADRIVVEGARLADNNFAGDTQIDLRDSLVVGRSGAGNDFPGVTGLLSYHDLIQATNVTWVNFAPGDALSTYFGGFQGAHFIVRGSTFLNASPIPRLQTGDAIFEDVDGSHFGEGYRVLVTDESMTTPDCANRPDLGGWLCAELYRYQGLHFDSYGPPVDLTRDDGLVVGQNFQTVTLSGREYTFNADLASMRRIILSAYAYVGDQSDWVRLVVPVGADQFAITGPDGETYQPVDSLDELNARADRVYFLDSDSGNLYLRMFSEGADRFVIVEDLGGPGGAPGQGHDSPGTTDLAFLGSALPPTDVAPALPVGRNFALEMPSEFHDVLATTSTALEHGNPQATRSSPSRKVGVRLPEVRGQRLWLGRHDGPLFCVPVSLAPLFSPNLNNPF